MIILKLTDIFHHLIVRTIMANILAISRYPECCYIHHIPYCCETDQTWLILSFLVDVSIVRNKIKRSQRLVRFLITLDTTLQYLSMLAETKHFAIFAYIWVLT